MPNYLIKKNNQTGEIIYMEYELDGYKFKPRNNSKVNLSLNKIMIIKPEMINKILTLKIKKRLDKIIKLVMYLLNLDDNNTNPSDMMLALNEISRLRNIILSKYQNYISQEKEMLFLKKLRVLENELRIKNLSMQEINNYSVGTRSI